MKDLKKEIDKYKDFETNEEHVDKFLDTLGTICQGKHKECIDDLYQCFNDHTDYFYVTQSLVKCLESFDIDIYLDSLVRNFGYLVDNSPECLDEMLNRILNEPTYRGAFLERIYLLDKHKLILALEVVKEESPHHEEFCNELINTLRKQL